MLKAIARIYIVLFFKPDEYKLTYQKRKQRL